MAPENDPQAVCGASEMDSEHMRSPHNSGPTSLGEADEWYLICFYEHRTLLPA